MNLEVIGSSPIFHPFMSFPYKNFKNCRKISKISWEAYVAQRAYRNKIFKIIFKVKLREFIKKKSLIRFNKYRLFRYINANDITDTLIKKNDYSLKEVFYKNIYLKIMKQKKRPISEKNISIIQRTNNHFNSTIYNYKKKYKTISTINIGTPLKFFGIKKKGLRRSTKGFLIFLNAVRRNIKKESVKIFLFKGVFYKLLHSKNTLRIFKANEHTIVIKNNNFFLKSKGKKIKSIRKRLKKKILLLNKDGLN